MSGSQRPEGFKADFYYSPETTLPNMQLNMSQVGENANWGMCLDSTIRSPTETKVTEAPSGRITPSAQFCSQT